MFPCLLLCTSRSDKTRKKVDAPPPPKGRDKCSGSAASRREISGVNFCSSAADIDLVSPTSARFPPSAHHLNWGREVKGLKKSGEMVNKTSNFSDLIQRAAASCLLHPLSSGRAAASEILGDSDDWGSLATDGRETGIIAEEEEEEDELDMPEDEAGVRRRRNDRKAWGRADETEALLMEVFEVVAGMKRAYVRLQEAHCPWDPDRMRAADTAMLGEFRKLAVLRERSKRRRRPSWADGCCCGQGGVGVLVREVVAPYEAAIEDLKREVKVKEAELDLLKEKINRSGTALSADGVKRSARATHSSRRKVSCSSLGGGVPDPSVFESTMLKVQDSSKSFTLLLLNLMRTAHWDIAAAVRSIEAATPSVDDAAAAPRATPFPASMASTISSHHAKYALESYISRKVFQGFDHESFYMDGTLSSLVNPDQFRRECFSQYQDMRAMDPSELLGILPTCQFGRFCCKKYLAIIHPKMEESLFGNLEQRQHVLAGNHPRSQFYSEFLRLTKAIWLLHLLAFSLDPAPCQFEASRGAEFHPQYMESVVKFSGGRIPSGQIVGFPVNPGFKLGNGSIVKARVYLVSRT